MKDKKISIINIIVILLLLLQVKLFYVIPSSIFYNISSNQQQILMVCVIIVGLLLGKKLITINKKGFSLGICLFTLYYIFELILSSFNNQGLVETFISSNFYLILLSYFIFMNYLKKNGSENFCEKIWLISSINIIICWIQYILSFKSIYFMQINTFNSRFGALRIQEFGETMTCLGILISLIYFLNSKKYKYLCIFILGILGNLVISKGRITLIALVISICFMIFSKYKNSYKKIIRGIFIGSICVIVFLQSNIGNVYLQSMNNSETDTGSIRIREINYYNNLTTQNLKTLLFGLGFIRDNGDKMSEILKGPTHQYSRTDVGIWGVANTLGIIGVIWYIFFTIKIIKEVKFISKYRKDSNYYIILGLTVFSIIYIPTMIMFNPYSITVFTILMAFIDYVYFEAIEENKLRNEENKCLI